MRWYDDLYIGYNAINAKKSILEKIKNGKFQLDCYVITLPLNNYDVIDVYPSYVLTQKWYMKSNIVIVGVGKGREETLDMVQLLLMDCLNDTGNLNVKEYILNKMVSKNEEVVV